MTKASWIRIGSIISCAATCSLIVFAVYDYESLGSGIDRGGCAPRNGYEVVDPDFKNFPIIGGRDHKNFFSKGQYALTFDDGPHPFTTLHIARILGEKCVPATFFVIGIKSVIAPWILRKQTQLGFGVASHSFFHADESKAPFWLAKIDEDIGTYFTDRISRSGDERTGAHLFRFPQSRPTRQTLLHLHDRGIVVVESDLSPEDWRNEDPLVSFARFKKRLNKIDRGIIVLHDSKPNTIKLLPMVISEIQARGGRFVSLKANPASLLVAPTDHHRLTRPPA